MTREIPGDPHLVRVEKGAASDEELAAVTALLMARAAQGPAPATTTARTPAPWRRPERARAYRAPHSWQG
ncbi:acyl-CoA carboxylase subunit epsilon [Streptomyces radicis]|uniref:Acyl-CoA carboxylase subunit epsilon n=1 Tax=Streptomyces radicis TaxID=1750517 RepID=A0A3A9WSY7_9ACTN|nr:acyl-CoA carboxylase subunit epsilon [Streptomyces radicis]RKN09247.1 acyl-CoA carboxylase subunit epsilon [Streptomyces radicis]RKN23155.1 acyl-CoA carboxylase subunit epsilon [Streptomyces radicis]